MELPYQIIEIFKTILSTTPKEVLDAQTSDSMLTIFENILVKLGYAGNIITIVIGIVQILWNIFKFIRGWYTGESNMKSIQD